ncbi:sigma-70 family RNA polymerase sigma factor [Tranquillimonas alkanivorans]|uniref:RNA polymerase sigma factor, sigma-70 family n=1 Tax=Tranquillimonas alkanivorans TaxID=441119 RepID=A0A1I5WFY0_9RHOB|nr:sigma-70 family RNA polymerase sigma factor [Tranquillimonas alkanivorans]SFQ18296.1 RNA polymerase sigma factor, sigma-70 family [Tranquillimonas alkanivorans]
MGKIKFLTREQVKDLAIRYQDGDEKAGAELLQRHMPMIISAARKAAFTHRVSELDVRQEYCAAFWRSLEKFDPHCGAALSSYAVYYMKSALLKYLSQMGGVVKVPNGHKTRQLLSKFGHLVHEYEKKSGMAFGEDGLEFVADELAIDKEEVRAFVMIMRPDNVRADSPTSLEAEDGNSGHWELEFASEDSSLNAISNYDQEKAREAISTIICRYYDERDQDIAMAQLLGDRSQNDLQALADKHDLSVERIRQIQRGSLELIRERLEARGIRSADDFAIANA